MGVEAAYKAVMKPTEGTILTVARVGAEHGADAASYQDDPVAVWRAVCDGARQALAQTPELLPVLKKAGVVDAGGKGLVLIWEGMPVSYTHLDVYKRQGGTPRPHSFPLQTVLPPPR